MRRDAQADRTRSAQAVAGYSGGGAGNATSSAKYVLGEEEEEEEEEAFEDPLEIEQRRPAKTYGSARCRLLFRQAVRKHSLGRGCRGPEIGTGTAPEEMSEILLKFKLHHVEVVSTLRETHAAHVNVKAFSHHGVAGRGGNVVGRLQHTACHRRYIRAR